IVFPNPLTVSYNGKALGSMAMPTVKAIANQGAALDLKNVNFTISDGAAFADFTSFALNNEKFDWTISTTGIVVNAMGASLPGVSMTKTVTLDGFNKLPGLQLLNYVINSIDAEGLHMVISATLNNPSTIGMTIPVSQFNTQFHGVVLGPAFAYNMALIPHSSSSFALNATITADGTNKKPYLEGIFHNALTGVATPLEAKGIAAPGVSWLDTAIKSLLLNTALPPLQEPPISSVAINSMEMDFACDTCVWAPTAISSITADTKLPFANGAPIEQLAQNIQILDNKGRVVGTLKTDYSDAVPSGSKVSTITKAAPLVIADGSHDIYTEFISDLNQATKYEVGLRGSADSVLNLGALGKINVNGIPIDVKTSLDGLQGLNNIKFLTLVNFFLGDQYMEVSSSVNIHNPSQLTLNIGDLHLVAGQEGFTDNERFGVAFVKGLRLVPGDNILVNVVTAPSTDPKTTKFGTDINVREVTLNMWADDKSTSNPALNAGLASLRQSVLLPVFLMTDAPKAYANEWSLKVLNSTVNDGLVEVSTVLGNPYFVDMTVVGDAKISESYSASDPSYFGISTGTSFEFTQLMFLPDFSFTVKAGQSLPITFKLKLRTNSLNAATLVDRMNTLINLGASGSFNKAYVNWTPKVTLTTMNGFLYPDFSTASAYPETGFMTLKVGSDFPMIKDWFYKQFNITTTPTVLPLPISTTETVLPSPTSTSLPPSPSHPHPHPHPQSQS
ncbi:hypothetical protein BGZ90_005808, partial [Linnemannia elongata]